MKRTLAIILCPFDILVFTMFEVDLEIIFNEFLFFLGSSGLDAKSNGKMTLIAFSYVLPTNIIACILAVVLCFLIKPGIHFIP